MKAFVQLAGEPSAAEPLSYSMSGDAIENIQIKLQALRADLEPRNTSASDAFHELNIQHGAVPRLWVSPFEFVTVEGDAGMYRLQTERGGWRRTLYATPSRCEMTAYLNEGGKSLRLAPVAATQLQTPPNHRNFWPAVLTSWAIGAGFGAAAVYLVLNGLIKLPF
jgi:hypothetical protein